MEQRKRDEEEFKLFYRRNRKGGERSWELRRNEIYGRYMVAVRDIQAGELVLSESPLQWGPNNSYNDIVCVACCRSVSGGPDTDTECQWCQLPVCSQNCEEMIKHRSLECSIFEQHKQKLNFKNADGGFDISRLPYDVILILRLLLLRDTNPEQWKTFTSLASLLDQWKEMDLWLENQEDKIKFIREDLGLTEFSREEILTVIAINCTNAFSKYLDPNSSPEYQDLIGSKLRAVFPMTAMISHSCLPTAEQNIHDHCDKLQLDLVAIRDIRAGEEITISYTELLSPTTCRQHSLLTNKLFLCQCVRCRDPREGGSLASAIKCPTCLRKNPSSPPGTLLCSPDPGLWTCDQCPAQLPSQQIHNLIFGIQDNLDSVMESFVEVEDLERMLKKYSRVLQPSNAMLVRLKYSLCGLYGRAKGYQLFSLSSVQLERKKTLCEETLQSLQTLQPGFSCRRGLVLYELHTALLLSGRNVMQVDKNKGRKYLKKSLLYLRECIKILSVQPKSTFPGQLYLGIEKTQKDIQDFIKSQLST